MQSPYSFSTQLLIIFLAAPIATLVFTVLARGWANTVQGGEVSKKTIARQRKESLAMLLATWIVGFGFIIFYHFVKYP